MKKRMVLYLLLVAFLAASAAPALAQARGAFSILCNVTGASVYLNGKLAGYTKPAFSALLRPGDYRVQVVMDNFHAFETVVNMTSNPQNLRVNLDPENVISQQRPLRGRYNLRVNANVVGAQVFVNNTPIGSAPASMKVDRGNYLVRVSAPGYLGYLTAVSVAGITTVNARLQASLVSVRVVIPATFLDDRDNRERDHRDRDKRDRDQIRLFVDGQSYDTLSFNLPPGRHNLRITSDGFSFSADFEFDPGKSYLLEPEHQESVPVAFANSGSSSHDRVLPISGLGSGASGAGSCR